MSEPDSRYFVVTDLDGSLLDHDNYSFGAARESLTLLRERDIIWVCNTSKTRAELARLQERLGNPYPYIVENGAAVIFPADFSLSLALPAELKLNGDQTRHKAFAMPRGDILVLLQQWRETYQFAFTGFADMTVSQLAQETGLDAEEAQAALQREYSEPILWQDSEPQWRHFLACLQAAGLKALKGGRFIHIMGQADKGQAMLWLRDQLFKTATPTVIALGDSDNDRAMLLQADIAVVIRSPYHEPVRLDDAVGRVVVTDEYGPAGWNAAICALVT